MNSVIIMADVVDSQEKDGQTLMRDFQALVKWANKIYQANIKSPLTVTLGDEFQGIVSSTSAGMELILGMEEHMIEQEFEFKLRYLVHYGEVETEINPDRAHGMLGPGLTRARQLLNQMKKDQGRFLIDVENSKAINKMARVTQHFIDSWHSKDRSTVTGFLQGHDYKELARIQQKDESSVWRRRRSLAIDEYLMCKDLLYHLMNE